MDLSRYSSREQWLIRAGLIFFTGYSVYHFLFYTVFFKWDRPKTDFPTYIAASIAYQPGNPIHNEGPWALTKPNLLQRIHVYWDDKPLNIMLYLYPPMLAWLLIPLTSLPYEIAEKIWTLGNLLFYITGVIVFLRRLYASGYLQCMEIFFFALLSLYWAPFYYAMWAGQITPVLFFLIILHIDFALQKWDFFSGFCLGFAILLKFSPLVFTGIWILHKRWNIVSGMGITLIAGTLLTGWSQTLTFLTSVLPHLMLGENTSINLTIMGIFICYVIDNPDGWLRQDYYSAIATSHTIIRIYLLMAWFLTAWGTWKKKEEWSIWLTFCLFVSSFLLLSPVERIYDYTFLYLTIVLGYVDYKRHPDQAFLCLLGLVALVFNTNTGGYLFYLFGDSIPFLMIDKLNVFSLFALWIMIVIRQKKYLYSK